MTGAHCNGFNCSLGVCPGCAMRAILPCTRRHPHVGVHCSHDMHGPWNTGACTFHTAVRALCDRSRPGRRPSALHNRCEGEVIIQLCCTRFAGFYTAQLLYRTRHTGHAADPKYNNGSPRFFSPPHLLQTALPGPLPGDQGRPPPRPQVPVRCFQRTSFGQHGLPSRGRRLGAWGMQL